MIAALAPIFLAIAGLVAIVSLIDSALKIAKAWRALMDEKDSL